jgi:hypothetical protein
VHDLGKLVVHAQLISCSYDPGAAFTLPSSISLIVQSNPDPHKQAKALAAFAAAGAVGNVAGFVLVSTPESPLFLTYN